MKKRVIYSIFICTIMLFVTGCGLNIEEKVERNKIEKQAKENAIKYIESKYGFTADVIDVSLNKYNSGDATGSIFADVNGYATLTLSYQNKEFKVKIYGKEETIDGEDNYQSEIILNDYLELITKETGLTPYKIEYNDSNKNMYKEYYTKENLLDFIKGYTMVLSYINVDGLEKVKEYSLFEGVKLFLVNYHSIDSYNNSYNHEYNIEGTMNTTYEMLKRNAINIKDVYVKSSYLDEGYHSFKVLNSDDIYYYNDNWECSGKIGESGCNNEVTFDPNNIIVNKINDIDANNWITNNNRTIYKTARNLSSTYKLEGKFRSVYVYIPITSKVSEKSEVKLGIKCNDNYYFSPVYTNQTHYIGEIDFNECKENTAEFSILELNK